jgi:hypothetical protein
LAAAGLAAAGLAAAGLTAAAHHAAATTEQAGIGLAFKGQAGKAGHRHDQGGPQNILATHLKPPKD